MAVGNKRQMIEIDGDYILSFCDAYCKGNGIKMKDLADELGHSGGYIDLSCKEGKIPKAELKLLCKLIGLDYHMAIKEDLPKEDTTGIRLARIEKKLDLILQKLEEPMQYSFGGGLNA